MRGVCGKRSVFYSPSTPPLLGTGLYGESNGFIVILHLVELLVQRLQLLKDMLGFVGG